MCKMVNGWLIFVLCLYTDSSSLSYSLYLKVCISIFLKSVFSSNLLCSTYPSSNNWVVQSHLFVDDTCNFNGQTNPSMFSTKFPHHCCVLIVFLTSSWENFGRNEITRRWHLSRLLRQRGGAFGWCLAACSQTGRAVGDEFCTETLPGNWAVERGGGMLLLLLLLVVVVVVVMVVVVVVVVVLVVIFFVVLLVFVAVAVVVDAYGEYGYVFMIVGVHSISIECLHRRPGRYGRYGNDIESSFILGIEG